MNRFEITSLQNSSVWNLYRMRRRIEAEPDYQRQSDVWTVDKRQLLIDTILNGLDVPKLYLHKFIQPKQVDECAYDYAIIDGKQRLQAIWEFIDGKFPLADEFEYYKDESVAAGGMTYDELGKTFPEIKTDFDSFWLSVMCIETDDIEMIEEMFSRLNEAIPLSAPEKRNAFGGPLPVAIRGLTNEPFFLERLPFGNSRYRHLDLAAKFLWVEAEKKVADTKKAYLDKFVKSYDGHPRDENLEFVGKARQTIDEMASLFTDRDALLRSVGMVMLYYHVFRLARDEGWTDEIARSRLAGFEQQRADNREMAKLELAEADYELLEFDKYTQSPNDGYAVRIRLRIILERVFNRKVMIEEL